MFSHICTSLYIQISSGQRIVTTRSRVGWVARSMLSRYLRRILTTGIPRHTFKWATNRAVQNVYTLSRTIDFPVGSNLQKCDAN